MLLLTVSYGVPSLCSRLIRQWLFYGLGFMAALHTALLFAVDCQLSTSIFLHFMLRFATSLKRSLGLPWFLFPSHSCKKWLLFWYICIIFSLILSVVHHFLWQEQYFLCYQYNFLWHADYSVSYIQQKSILILIFFLLWWDKASWLFFLTANDLHWKCDNTDCSSLCYVVYSHHKMTIGISLLLFTVHHTLLRQSELNCF